MNKTNLNIVIFDLDDIKNPLLGGGQAWATFEVGRRLAQNGHKVTVISSKYPNYKDRTQEGIDYKHIGINTKFIKLNNLLYLFAAPLYAMKTKADIIVECFTAPVSTLFTPLFTRTPVVALPSMFNAHEFTKKYHLPFHLVERLGARFYKYLLPYSEIDSSKMKKLNPGINFKIVPQGVAKEYFAIKQRKPEHILFLSRLDIEQKGVDLLLMAYAKVSSKIKYPLVIAGHGPDEKKIRALIKKLGLQNKVKMVGAAYGKKKFDLMAKALFVAFPSRHDEMCLWSLEALAGGLPLVGFNLPESKWMTKDISLKSKRFNVDEYASTLLEATDPGVIDQMRTNARTFARKFSWEKVTAEYESFFYQILENEGTVKVPTLISYERHIPKISDEGFLSFAESKKHIPFNIKRFYYITDVQRGKIRGMHAHRKNRQFAFCIQGKVKMTLDDGSRREEVILNKSNQGLYLDKMVWHEMTEFEKGTTLLVIASEYFEKKDYIRNYQEFKQLVEKKHFNLGMDVREFASYLLKLPLAANPIPWRIR
ncbi:MAG: WxcM-like domain-containing protein [Candidatus Curtissbacteria bacterium]|nr:WxcM-like domain-containing protein [Candidatus Curtissbacteria bacterium]